MFTSELDLRLPPFTHIDTPTLPTQIKFKNSIQTLKPEAHLPNPRPAIEKSTIRSSANTNKTVITRNVCGGRTLDAVSVVASREKPGVEGTMAYFRFDERYTRHLDARETRLSTIIEPNTEGNFTWLPIDSASEAGLD